MSILGALSASTLAMLGQSTALHQIGTNVANVQTGGYKRSDIHFQSVLGNQMFKEHDQGGIRPIVLQRIDSQGIIKGTDSSIDLGISGSGFFIASTDFAGTDIVYTRDGSFRQAPVNDITVTDPISGETSTTKDGYLVDKNGYFILGFEPNTDGTFPSTGTPVAMRVDKNSFSDSGLPTTEAELIVNLDSNAPTVSNHLTAVNNYNTGGLRADGMEVLTVNLVDANGNARSARINFTKSDVNTWNISATYQGAGTAQVDTVTLAGTIDAGDVYKVTVGGTVISYTATATDTLSTVVSGLVSALNADSAVSAAVTATAGSTAGTITLTAATAGTPFTSSVSTTYSAGTAQVNSLTVSGSVEAGDVYQVTVGGTTASYTVTGGEGSLAGVVNGIISTINNTSPINASVLASLGTTPGTITVTAKSSGTPFTMTARAIDASSTAQVDTATIGSLSSTYEAGDIYSVTIGGTTVSYTVTGGEGGLAGIRSALRTAINANTTLGNIVTAADGGPAGNITLTAQVPGTAFTATVAATNGGATNDNTAAIVTTTANLVGATPNTATVAVTVANVTPTNDNTASVATTTANNTGLVTSSVTQVPFLGDGRAGTPDPSIVGGVISPSDISFSFSYPASGSKSASTASFTLDVSGITQFDHRFQLQSYSQNGKENALIESVGFDNKGHVLGYFSNGTSVALYKVPLASFINPNGLATESGMVFRETEKSGTPSVETVDSSGIASFIPSAYEISNVNLVDEFSAMIRTQQAYNSSATAFKTIDEMFQTATQIKR